MNISLRLIKRASVAFAHDMVMVGISFVAALYLRLGNSLFVWDWTAFWIAGGLLLLVAAPVLWFSGLYRGIWRYASLDDMINIARAGTLILLLFLPVMFLINRLDAIPRSTLLINWFVLLALLAGPRVLYRLFKDRHAGHVLERRRTTLGPTPVLLVGAGDDTETFIRDLSRRRNAGYTVVGIIDEKGNRTGRQIRNIRVMGDLSALPSVVERLQARGLKPQRMIVTKRRLAAPIMNELLDLAEAHGMTLARLPELTEFQRGGDSPIQLRPVDIEDLLGRPQAVLDRDAMRAMIAGRQVLVTGAGGTIGSELTRQIAALGPASLTLVDNAEFNLYEIDRQIGDLHPGLPRHALLADVRDRVRLDHVFKAHTPQIVFHAAALKHVPLVEANPTQGAATNVVGGRNVAELCIEHRVAAMVQISTDKAVNPVSVMGATKRLAEAYCQALDIAGAAAEGAKRAPRFVTVRFGNVLGSSGSVVPLFQKQLAAGGPLTVTHPDAVRYFMTVREAVELVLQASVLGTASDDAPAGRIMVLDMGEPIRILDLARRMAQLAGLRPDHDIEIKITGLRPGERLAEDLFHEMESLDPTENAAIRVARPRAADRALLARAIDDLERLVAADDDAGALALLKRTVPEFQHATAAPPLPAGTATTPASTDLGQTGA